MSGRPQKDKKKDDDDLFGALAGGLLMAGAAALAGYGAYKMFKKEEPEKSKTTKAYTDMDRSSYRSHSFNSPVVKKSYDLPSSNCSPWQTSPSATGSWMGAHSSSNFVDAKGTKCIGCQVNEREVLFEPCRHIRLCEDCADTTIQCPECYMGIVAKKPIYL